MFFYQRAAKRTCRVRAIALGFLVADAVFHEKLGADQGKIVKVGNMPTLGKMPKLDKIRTLLWVSKVPRQDQKTRRRRKKTCCAMMCPVGPLCGV